MSFLTKLGIDPTQASIDWDLQPADTFGMFESWGGKERVKNKNERFYYFYIDSRSHCLCTKSMHSFYILNLFVQ